MIKINFLYWNAKNNDISSYIVDACVENNVNLLILVEHKNIDTDYLIRKLEDNNLFFEVERIDKDSRILLLHNTIKQINIIKESKYYSAFIIKDEDKPYLIFALHLPSRYAEERSDFNMNPFDDGMVSALGFNAVMCPSIAKKKSRKVLNEERKFYYNPMWHLMGNALNACKGTFYYPSDTKSYYWYTYDQVIIRPELIEKFDMDDLKIIDAINNNSLVSVNNIPNKRLISDHLPIKFKIKLEVNENNG